MVTARAHGGRWGYTFLFGICLVFSTVKSEKKFCISQLLSFLFLFLFFFCLFRAAPAAYGGSQARGRIELWPPCGIPAASATYSTAHSNAGSLTH